MSSLSTYFSFYISLAKSLLALAFARLYGPQEINLRNLTGQTAIVTGANSGIGLSIATALAEQGATVCLACRNVDRGAAAVEQIISLSGEKSKERVFFRILDVGDLSSVREFCKRWVSEGKDIDILAHNAGIAGVSESSKMHAMYTTNFLGSFLMTYLLLPVLSPTARVVMTSSTGSYAAASHFLQPQKPTTPKEKKSSGEGLVSSLVTRVKAFLNITESVAPAYSLSKAQQVLFASLLQRHFSSSKTPHNKRTAHAFTPGFTSTPIFGKFETGWQTWLSNPLFAALKLSEKWIALATDEGAKTGAWLATWGDELGRKGQGGGYWERMTPRTSFVPLMCEKRKREEWQMWERDAGIVWNMSNPKE